MRLAPLIGLVLVAWALILAEIYAFFFVILAYTPPLHELGSLTALGLGKIVATLGLGLVWFLVMSYLARRYTEGKLKRLPPTPSS